MSNAGQNASDSEVLKPGRLKSRPEFLAVQRGERLKGRYVLIEELDRNEPDTPPRVGFTVTKRQGNAVERNRMRRRIKEAVRLSAGSAMKPGHDYVIVARRDVLSTPFAELSRTITNRIAGNKGQKRPKTVRPGKTDGRK